MDRLSVIIQAALALRGRRTAPPVAGAPATRDELPSLALVEDLCVSCAPQMLRIERVAADDVILGGARARLQLRNWTKPERGGRIWVQTNLTLEEQAFSIAHELGHFILHRGEGETPRCPADAINEQADISALRVEREGRVEEYNPRARRELEANAFAAELLAPGWRARALYLTLAPGEDPAQRVAAAFGISERLARWRLVAAVLSGITPPREADAPAEEPAPALDGDRAALAQRLLASLDDYQLAAARAPGPALVVAGPGTGKTATLVGRVAYLYGERGVKPEAMLALTFSNRAADEMRERLVKGGLPGERIPVLTIHAAAAELLRRYASHAPHAAGEQPLPSDFRILDRADSLLLLEELLPKLKLRRLRNLGDPAAPLPALLNDFSWARDRLLSPEDYVALVEATPIIPPPGKGEKRAAGTFTEDDLARAREQARAYAVWDHELRLRGLLDYGGLIQRAVETLRATPEALDELRARYPHILVDEFQDTNEAAAELLFLLVGEQGAGLWVVGDRNQSIYRWRGAAPDNLPALTRRYPRLAVHTLRVNYRSTAGIVQLGSDMAARMAALANSAAIHGRRMEDAAIHGRRMEDAAIHGRRTDGGASDGGALAEALRPVRLSAQRGAAAGLEVWRGESYATPEDERAAIVADIQRRHAAGLDWGAMAALSYKSKLGRALASDLARAGVPVTAPREFFERDEVKDTLALLRLATSSDAGGLLRMRGLLALLGVRALAAEDERAFGRAIRQLAREGAGFPRTLRDMDALRAAAVPAALLDPLARLGQEATALGWAQSGMSARLAEALLATGGLAWRLARIAAGQDDPVTRDGDPLGEPGHSRERGADALAALGALVSLAARFDQRWNTEDGFKRQLSGLAARDEEENEAEPSQPASAGFAAVRPLWEPRTQRGASLHSPLREPRTQRGASLHSPLGAGSPTGSLSAGDTAADEERPDRAARCFLRYLDAFARSKDEVALPPSEEDAVHILTIHAAKGLEFPAVYLHAVAQAGFSHGGGARPANPARPRARDAYEADADTPSLLYVAATRARDALIITRARRYSEHGSSAALPAAAIMEASEMFTRAAALPDVATADTLAPAPIADAVEGDAEADVDADVDLDAISGASSVELAPVNAGNDGLDTAGARASYLYFALETYAQCPRRYAYRYDFRLRDGRGPAVDAFHRFIRAGLVEQRRLRAERPGMTPAEAREALAALWDAQPGVRGAHDALYRAYALDILDAEWERIPEGAEPQRLDLTARLRRCDVQLNVDALVSHMPGGDEVILERWHTGRAAEKHKLDPRLPLMLMGYEDHDPQARVVSVRLVYLGAPLSEVGAASPDELREAARRRQVVDVTEKARQYAGEYRSGEPKQYRQLANLDDAARGIAARRFEPKRASHCATCPFTHICPGLPPE